MSLDPTRRATGWMVAAARLAVAALIAGTVLGITARLLMRAIALEAGLPGAYSLGGTVDVVAFGLLTGAPIAAAFWVLRPRISWAKPFAGLALGALLTTSFVLLPPASARSALAGTPDTPLFTWIGFGVLFVGWGAALDVVASLIRPRR